MQEMRKVLQMTDEQKEPFPGVILTGDAKVIAGTGVKITTRAECSHQSATGATNRFMCVKCGMFCK